MPNWIEGTFRARGSKENIKKFILEGLEACYRLKITTEIEEDDDRLYVTFKNPEAAENDKIEYPKTLHIKDTRRNFIEDLWMGEIYAYKKKNGEFQFASSFKSAWPIDIEPLANIAKRYEIDIRVNGYEKGMQFEQLLEVSRNGTVKCIYNTKTMIGSAQCHF